MVALGSSALAADALVYYFAAYAAANLGELAVLAALGRYDIKVNRSLVRTARLRLELRLRRFVRLLVRNLLEPPDDGCALDQDLDTVPMLRGYVPALLGGPVDRRIADRQVHRSGRADALQAILA